MAKPVSIPFPLGSSPGAYSQESAGRLINCYAEPLGKDVQFAKGMAPPAVVWRKCPGLTLFAASAAQTGFRGGIKVDNTLYAAWAEKATTFTSGGVETVLSGGIPDRVPVDLHNFLMTAQASGLPFAGFLQNGEALAEGQIRAWNEFHHDVLLLENAPVLVSPVLRRLEDDGQLMKY